MPWVASVPKTVIAKIKLIKTLSLQFAAQSTEKATALLKKLVPLAVLALTSLALPTVDAEAMEMLTLKLPLVAL
jgi:hypothetical protein